MARPASRLPLLQLAVAGLGVHELAQAKTIAAILLAAGLVSDQDGFDLEPSRSEAMQAHRDAAIAARVPRADIGIDPRADEQVPVRRHEPTVGHLPLGAPGTLARSAHEDQIRDPGDQRPLERVVREPALLLLASLRSCALPSMG